MKKLQQRIQHALFASLRKCRWNFILTYLSGQKDQLFRLRHVYYQLVLLLLAMPCFAQVLPQGHFFYGQQTVGTALAREIAVGFGEVWIIGNEPFGDGNYNVMHLVGNQFERVPGMALKIAVDGQGVPWVVTAQGQIWRCNPAAKAKGDWDNLWDNLPGKASEIAAGGDEVWIIAEKKDPDNDISRWDGTNWVTVPGQGAKISVTANGTAYVVNSLGNLYRRTKTSTVGFVRIADGVSEVNATPFLRNSAESQEIVVTANTAGRVATLSGDSWYASNGDGIAWGQNFTNGPYALRVARDNYQSLRVYAILANTPYGQAGPVIIGEPNEDSAYAAPVIALAGPTAAILGFYVPAEALTAETARSDIYSTYTPPEWMRAVGRSWMSWLPDNTALDKVSIPGTHDSGARFGTGEDIGNRVAITQIWTIKDQLEAGVRYFDIRVRPTIGGLAIHHGPIFQKLMFADVMSQVSEFLAANPREVLVMNVADAGVTAEAGAPSHAVLWANVKTQYPNVYGNFNTFNPRPTLGALRGKVYFLFANNFGDNSSGVSFKPDLINYRTDPNVFIQNAYKVFAGVNTGYDDNGNELTVGQRKKFELIVEALNVAINPANTKWVFNGLAGSEGLYPSTIAENMNQWTYEALTDKDLPNKLTLGTLIMDFPGEALLTRILSSNFNL